MLSTAVYIALCVQVADLSSLYVMFAPDTASQSAPMDDAAVRWADQLRQETSSDGEYVAAMHDGFIQAMALNGSQFWAQWEDCQVQLDAPIAPPPGEKG